MLSAVQVNDLNCIDEQSLSHRLIGLNCIDEQSLSHRFIGRLDPCYFEVSICFFSMCPKKFSSLFLLRNYT